ncbi:MAG: hypothetical protein FJ096_18360 [Deltaproteobacteria bacterium]|nr:hypothetical protein [Deltaproteobacteria bacterium]
MNLPPPEALERICKGLAVLDAILCEDWELRLFSFNAEWGASRGERMASMRNGEGDSWFIVFSGVHAFFKAYWHEHERVDPTAIYDGLPTALEPHRHEPAFSMSDVTFGGWYEPERGWTLRGTLEPFTEELSILTGATAVVHAYLASYFEVDVPLDAIEHVVAGEPLEDALVRRLAAGRSSESLRSDLDEIGY